jgi:hypothetical protein
VRAGRKYWPNQTPVAGRQFEHTHDDIGNRTVPGAVDVMSLGFATNAVTVNGQTAYRKGEYFRKEIPVSNGSVPVWQSITNAATGQASITGKRQIQFLRWVTPNWLSGGDQEAETSH